MAPGNQEEDTGPLLLSGQEVVKKRFAQAALFRGLPPAAAAALFDEMGWFSVPGGRVLFRQGEEGDTLYLVVSGRLAILVEGEGGASTLVAEIGVGETVGEMALISGEKRSATVKALRDTELLELTRQSFGAMLERHPHVALPLARDLAGRLTQRLHHQSPGRSVRSFALVPLAPGLPLESLGRNLAAALSAYGPRVELLDPTAGMHETEWFHARELANDFTIYCAELECSPWTKLCLRQADRILLVARSDGPLPPTALHEQLLAEVSHRALEILLLEPDESRLPGAAAAWLGRFPGAFHSRLRPSVPDDTARLARLLVGRAVGLVLSGGGARGLAHIGVVRALREAKIPLDLLGGTSMGAIVAAGTALEWTDRELKERLRHAFVETNPLSDFTLPLISFTRGRKVSRMLHTDFGEARVEDLWRPFFCMSSNLTTARAVVHRDGPLWRALRTSVAIPGLLSPMIENGEVLVDGGVMDNLPTALMRAARRGPVIGVDVGTNRTLKSTVEDLENTSLWRLFLHDRRRVPWIVPVLVRAGTVSSDVQNDRARRQADLIIAPPLEEVDLLDWKAFDRAVEIGYRHTMERLEHFDRSKLLAVT